MPKSFTFVVVVLALIGMAGSGSARASSQEEMRSLDDQVQEIKTDVLRIAAELSQLEEQLLYPSNTQVSVFVALSSEHAFRLDAMQIHIDGQLAAHHIYSFKELDALESGGVQRIYTGNFPTGAHHMQVSVIGKLSNGEAYQRTAEFSFDKGVDPRLLGLAVAGPGAGEAIELQDW